MASTDPTRALCFIIEENFAQKQMLREKGAIIEALQNQVRELQLGLALPDSGRFRTARRCAVSME
ncbi:hypothetical protein MCOR30_008573 [Pyricularia oryzae]|nr:hypothetical protein MCOR30_008573 [Pyricularia oryzae]